MLNVHIFRTNIVFRQLFLVTCTWKNLPKRMFVRKTRVYKVDEIDTRRQNCWPHLHLKAEERIFFSWYYLSTFVMSFVFQEIAYSTVNKWWETLLLFFHSFDMIIHTLFCLSYLNALTATIVLWRNCHVSEIRLSNQILKVS